jgi:hypothetical protein
VRVEDVPERGVQPQVVVDATGAAHLIYLKGEPKACDVRYVRRAKGAHEWSAPMPVNSDSRTAVAMGTIRGAQFALGQRGTLHVVWNGAMQHSGSKHGSPLFYTRLEAGQSEFAPQRNLLGDTGALDGGASVAADEKGSVFVVWHGQQPGLDGESARVVFVLKSTDNGQTFGTPIVANPDFTGTCACCSLKALATPDGQLFTLYRAAHVAVDRDLTLLASSDGGEMFTRTMLDPWKTSTCPMSSAALLSSSNGVRAAWETDGKIRTAILGSAPPPADLASGKAKHPAMAINARGEVLVAWTIGTGWNRGGELGWTILDASGRPGTARGNAKDVPAWSYAAACAESDGEFVILR